MPVVFHPRARKSGIVPNGARVREAILHVIREADRHGTRLSQFDILKSLFLADRAHLNRYGRPITFDEYVAMQDGPVPSLAFDVLKEALSAMREAGIEEPLWESVPAGEKKMHFFSAQREASEEVLAESDIEELSEAAEFVRSAGYRKTWDRVHADRAYIEAWAKRGSAKQHHMEYALMFDEPNQEAAEDLKFASAHL